MSGQNLAKNAKKYIENQKLTPKYFRGDILSYFQTMCGEELVLHLEHQLDLVAVKFG